MGDQFAPAHPQQEVVPLQPGEAEQRHAAAARIIRRHKRNHQVTI